MFAVTWGCYEAWRGCGGSAGGSEGEGMGLRGRVGAETARKGGKREEREGALAVREMRKSGKQKQRQGRDGEGWRGGYKGIYGRGIERRGKGRGREEKKIKIWEERII